MPDAQPTLVEPEKRAEGGRTREVRVPPLAGAVTAGSLADIPFANATEAPTEAPAEAPTAAPTGETAPMTIPTAPTREPEQDAPGGSGWIGLVLIVCVLSGVLLGMLLTRSAAARRQKGGKYSR